MFLSVSLKQNILWNSETIQWRRYLDEKLRSSAMLSYWDSCICVRMWFWNYIDEKYADDISYQMNNTTFIVGFKFDLWKFWNFVSNFKFRFIQLYYSRTRIKETFGYKKRFHSSAFMQEDFITLYVNRTTDKRNSFLTEKLNPYEFILSEFDCILQ